MVVVVVVVEPRRHTTAKHVPMVVTCRVNTVSFPCLLQDAANCDSAPAGGNTYLRVVGDANKHLRTLLFAWCAGHED